MNERGNLIAQYLICQLLSLESSYTAWQQSAEGLKCCKIKKTQTDTSPDSSFSQAKQEKQEASLKQRRGKEKVV